jgi:hypothetical protein
LNAFQQVELTKRQRRVVDYRKPTTFKEETVGISTHEEKMIQQAIRMSMIEQETEKTSYSDL